MPDEAAVPGGGQDMTRAHRHEQGLDVDVLAVHRGPDGVAEDEAEGVDVVLVPGGEDAVLPAGGHAQQTLHVLLVLVSGLDVPEDDRGIGPVHLGVRVDHGPREVGPPVVRTDVGEVDEGVDRQGDPQGAPLPGAGANLLTRHLHRGVHKTRRSIIFCTHQQTWADKCTPCPLKIKTSYSSYSYKTVYGR